MVFNHATAKLVVYSTLAFGVFSNLMGIVSCNLLEYTDSLGARGTLGLYNYGSGSGLDCQPYSNNGMEDESFRPARVGAISGMCLAILLIALNAIHNNVQRIPMKDTIFYTLGGAIQVSLALIYTMRENDLCDAFGCRLGEGASWTGLAQIMYMGATIVSLFADDSAGYVKKPYSSTAVPKRSKVEDLGASLLTVAY